MRKIPTVFERDAQDRRHLTDTVTPGCEWVVEGRGVATRKLDGIAVLIDDTDRAAWTRRELKPGQPQPTVFRPVSTDPVTGKTVGWVLADRSGYWRLIEEAAAKLGGDPPPGTYELVGPKVNGNPERYDEHTLVPHGQQSVDEYLDSRSYDDLRSVLLSVFFPAGWEGIVFWAGGPDDPMAKIKVRDVL